MHIEVDLGLFFWKINLNLPKNLFLKRNRVNDKIQIDMVPEIFQKSQIQPPGTLETEVVKRKIHLLEGRIQRKEYVFFDIDQCIISDLVVGQV